MEELEEPKQKEYMFCVRCNATMEKCQSWQHRGITSCMACGGGLGDRMNRYCMNCVDLPARKRREERSGKRIVYLSEMTDEEIVANRERENQHMLGEP
jgi:hypothetical protein